jgi:hypothetical protein
MALPITRLIDCNFNVSMNSIENQGAVTVMADEVNKTRPKSNWAQIISASVGVIAIVGVAWQAYAIRKNFSESAARQVYMSYSEASLRTPALVEPDLDKLKANHDQYVQYKSFVAHMLFAYDEIFRVYDEPEWHKSFDSDVKYHMQYICNDMLRSDDETYFEKMRIILKELRKSCPARG